MEEDTCTSLPAPRCRLSADSRGDRLARDAPPSATVRVAASMEEDTCTSLPGSWEDKVETEQLSSESEGAGLGEAPPISEAPPTTEALLFPISSPTHGHGQKADAGPDAPSPPEEEVDAGWHGDGPPPATSEDEGGGDDGESEKDLSDTGSASKEPAEDSGEFLGVGGLERELPPSSGPPPAPSHRDEDVTAPSWRAHRKHVFVLSEAGKPIYSRYGNEEALSSTMGVMMALVSFVQAGDNVIRSIQSGKGDAMDTRGPVTGRSLIEGFGGLYIE
uniref:vacuolar fusion protein MON1 homolog A-like n=1 Tax=Pristiophorus japonicus TaxID=55135 RepID=UPI00398F58A0